MLLTTHTRSAPAPPSALSAINLQTGMALSTRLISRLWPVGFVFSILCAPAPARASEHWKELNIGPFYVDSDGDTAAARDALTQLEQFRWVMAAYSNPKISAPFGPFALLLVKRPK